MKISEKLAELKRKEGELMRTYDLRDSVIRQGFKDMLITTENLSSADIEMKQREFLAKKKLKVAELTSRIAHLTGEIIEGKKLLNKKNVELGVDDMLVQMKFLRLELSKLMNLIKKDRYGIFGSGTNIDIDIFEELGIANRIKELETIKSKLDAQIQQANWSNEL